MGSRPFPLGGVSAAYLEAMYAAWLASPDAVDPSWRMAFDLAAELVGWPAGHRRTEPPRGPLAVETAHIDDPAVRDRLIALVAAAAPVPSSRPAGRLALLGRLSAAEAFETFLAQRAPTKKRFGIEGAESLIPLLDRILEKAAAAGVTQVIIGSMHRGRLNVMANVLGEPLPWLLARFLGAHPFPSDPGRAGDVVYHLGCERAIPTPAGPVLVSLLPNPSHLEAVNAVALGRARALQDMDPGRPPSAVLALILHTDASVIAQGVVAECLQLGGVEGFSTAGAVHVIVNNRIGFTTEPSEARTSLHCTGAWKAIDSAILHVDGDDPEAVLRAADIAVDFRQAEGKEAVIDLICHRRHGHNELDEPRFTQPLLYRSIDARPGVRAAYAARLAQSGEIEAGAADRLLAGHRARLEAAFEGMDASKAAAPKPQVEAAEGDGAGGDTGVAEDRLGRLLARLSHVPSDLQVHPKIGRIVRQRLESAKTGIAWATAEALAFATLLTEGVGVRLSGQDSVRGAFSQRHLALFDAHTGKRHVLLDHLAEGQARFDAVNSPLSEYAVLAFEYGYSLGGPGSLVVWEAQFGDFANGAQVVIDQFIVSAEEKWRQRSGLVVLLPHGLEGQGPEHSSARIERLLLLGAGDNILIANPSTPASYFHLLRRQALGGRGRPLFVTSPKTLLRLKAATSPLADFLPGEGFRPVMIDEPSGRVGRILICSGKVAYDLLRERERRREDRVAIVRVEQLYPFPLEGLEAVFARWPDASVCWVQEEPANMGPWPDLDRRLRGRGRTVECISRPESSSPAGGFHGSHANEQEGLIRRAF